MKEALLLAMFLLSFLLVKFLRREAVFVPLPTKTVEKALRLAKIKKSDILYDLGSGDGRVVMAASKSYGIKSVGIERNRVLCWMAKVERAANSLQDRVNIVRGDLFKQNISEATVVTVYLTQKLNDMLESKLKGELKRGTRVVSADHVFKNMKEIRKVKAGHFYLHLYKI